MMKEVKWNIENIRIISEEKKVTMTNDFKKILFIGS
jgi:hypothetical protein